MNELTNSSGEPAAAGSAQEPHPTTNPPQVPRSGIVRARSTVGAVFGTLLGFAPHVFHYIGLVAGAAFVVGAGGNALFFLVGLLFSIPLLRNLHRRFSTWRAPAIAIAAFTALFSLSAFVVGPAITGGGSQVARRSPRHRPTPDTTTSERPRQSWQVTIRDIGNNGGMTTEPATHGRVLIVEDEPILAGTVRNYLERAGFETRWEVDGLRAVESVHEWGPDLVVLDLGLPSLDGMEVCRRLRTFSDCYIIMLTARADEVDTLVGLSVGADDYITKPFSTRELVARVQARLRRPRLADGPERVTETPNRVFGTLVIDPMARQVVLDGIPVVVTPTEFDVLDVLSGQPRVAFSRRQLIDVIWGAHWGGDEHMVDVHIANLRRKLGDNPTNPRFVATVRGHGYRMGPGS